MQFDPRDIDIDEWYFQTKDGETKGPVSKRDIDVEWRTNAITSDTLVYKRELGNWKKLRNVGELVKLLNIANAEFNEEVLRAREELSNLSNPLITASKVGRYAPYQSADGLWHYYDPKLKQWKTSKEDPHSHTEHKKSEDLSYSQKINKGEIEVKVISNEELVKLEEEKVI